MNLLRALGVLLFVVLPDRLARSYVHGGAVHQPYARCQRCVGALLDLGGRCPHCNHDTSRPYPRSVS